MYDRLGRCGLHRVVDLHASENSEESVISKHWL